ncbi:hypothetical protein LCGC14_2212190, partial [marine sediment metagenome]
MDMSDEIASWPPPDIRMRSSGGGKYTQPSKILKASECRMTPFVSCVVSFTVYVLSAVMELMSIGTGVVPPST